MKSANTLTKVLNMFCLATLMGSFAALAGDNATLVSVSVPLGTQLPPGTIFTNTWTIENTGTTTWSAGEPGSGYNLVLVGRDSLGAVPFSANTTSSWRSPPSAIIGSGTSVPPGGKATFSFTFIAPESVGSVTDVFQLCNAKGSNFGPQVTVQITVAQAGPSAQLDRSKTISYANNYDPYVCSDGYFWTDGSDYVYYGVGSPAPTNLIGDDCAHFCSCCIGNQAAQAGGGFNIASRVPPTYGEPGAQRLLYTNLISEGLAVEVYSLSDLEPGDLVGWNWEGDTSTADIDHVTLYLGNGLLASHAVSALDVSATTFFQDGTPDWEWHLIHILDVSAPAVTATVSDAATYGQMVLFTVTVAPTPSSGTVQFYDNGVALGSPLAANYGTETFLTSLLSAGNHPITATFSGTSNLQPSSTTAPVTQQVSPAPLTITANSQSKVYGTALTFGGGSAQFTSSGLVNFDSIGTVTLTASGNGGAANAPVGTYSITPSLATGGTFTAGNYNITYDPGTLSVTLPPNTVPVSIAMTPMSAGTMQLNFTGTPGYIYLIETATNLIPPVTWTPVSTNAANGNGQFNFIDTNAGNCGACYYRTAIQ